MPGIQRTHQQFLNYTAEQYDIAIHHGLQADTPSHVARMSCVSPQDLTLKPSPLATLKPKKSTSKKSPKMSGAASPYPHTSPRSARTTLDYIATRESVKMEEQSVLRAEAKMRLPSMPCRPSDCVRVPQTLVPDPSFSIVFSKRGVEGVPQTHCQNMDRIDGCNDPIVLAGEPKRIVLVLAWPGYRNFEFTLDLRKQDETTMLPVKRPICRSEFASDILTTITRWFHVRAMELDGPESDHDVPRGWKIKGGWPDIKADMVWLTKFGPVRGGDGTRWAAELFIEPGRG